jgi:hypothetical protein
MEVYKHLNVMYTLSVDQDLRLIFGLEYWSCEHERLRI